MSGVILAVLEHPASAARTLAAAQGIAGLMGHARINVLAVRVPPESTILPTEEVLTSQAAARIRADERVRVAALRQAFEAWCDGARSGGTAARVFLSGMRGPGEPMLSFATGLEAINPSGNSPSIDTRMSRAVVPATWISCAKPCTRGRISAMAVS